MRLIDADALPISFDGHTVSVWKKDLDEAPTVNPDEWNEITYKVDEYGSVVFDKGQPPFNTFVNVYCPDNKCIYTAYWSYSDRVWKEPYMMNDFNLRITHWRPHPAPPIEKEN